MLSTPLHQSLCGPIMFPKAKDLTSIFKFSIDNSSPHILGANCQCQITCKNCGKMFIKKTIMRANTKTVPKLEYLLWSMSWAPPCAECQQPSVCLHVYQVTPHRQWTQCVWTLGVTKCGRETQNCTGNLSDWGCDSSWDFKCQWCQY